jgi:hypothetical protein
VGADGEFVLSVHEQEGALLRVELRSHKGRALMGRDLDGQGASCAGRARSIAVIVQRYLEALPAPPIGMRRAVPPPPVPEPFARLEPRAGFSLDAGLGADTVVGAALGTAVRPRRWLALHLVGRLHVGRTEPVDTGEVSMSRHNVALYASAGRSLGAGRLEAGLGGRVDFVSVRTSDLALNSRSTQTEPAAIALLGAGLALRGPLLAFATAELYAHPSAQSFRVEGFGEVARAARYGLAFVVGFGYAVLAH